MTTLKNVHDCLTKQSWRYVKAEANICWTQLKLVWIPEPPNKLSNANDLATTKVAATTTLTSMKMTCNNIT